MPLADLLAPDAVFPSLRASSKKQALQELAQHAADLAGRDQREIFETLLQRERLGSTGVGNGIAIPHGKLPGLPRLFGAFARLEKPIDFESLDGEPVDLWEQHGLLQAMYSGDLERCAFQQMALITRAAALQTLRSLLALQQPLRRRSRHRPVVAPPKARPRQH